MGDQYNLRLLIDDSAVRKLEERLNKIMGIGSSTSSGSSSSSGGIFGGNVSKNILKLGTIAVGVGSLVMLVKKISELALESSPILQAMFKIFNTSILLIFRPIGDFIGFFLRPILVYFLRNIALPFYLKWGPIAAKLGTWLGEQVTPVMESVIKPIFDNPLKLLLGPDLGDIANFFNAILPDSVKKWKNSIGEIDVSGITTKISGVFDSFVSRINRYFIGFITGVRKPLDSMFNFFTGIWNYVSEKLKPLWDTIEGFFNWIIETFKPLIDFVTNLFKPYDKPRDLGDSGQGAAHGNMGNNVTNNYIFNGAINGAQDAIQTSQIVSKASQQTKRPLRFS